jgi:hypothetical protein
MNEITDVYLQTNFQDFVIYELPIKPSMATPALVGAIATQPLDQCFDLINKLYQTKSKIGFKTSVDEYEIHVEKLGGETTYSSQNIFYLDEQYHNNIRIIGINNNCNNCYCGKLTDIYINEYDIIQGKKFRDYFDLVQFRYTNILFCKPDFFNVFNLYKDTFQDITLVSSSSDYPVTDELVKHLETNNKLVKWYGVNMTASSTKCVALPLGITSFDTKQTGRFIGFSNDITENHRILADCKTIIQVRNIPTKKDKLLYLNFDDNTDTERKKIKDMFFGGKWVTIGNMDKSYNGRRKYLEEVHEHKYVLCPRGNGIDTHRIWESLYVGSVPVVKMEKGIESFTDLPILFVSDWKLVTEELLLEKDEFFYQTVWNLEKLFFNYWKCRISMTDLKS